MDSDQLHLNGMKAHRRVVHERNGIRHLQNSGTAEMGTDLLMWTVYVAGATAILIGGFWLLVAWPAGFAARWSAAGEISMKTNTALALTLAGIALLLIVPATACRSRKIGGTVLALLVFLIGALTLSEHLFGLNLGVDQLLATEAPGAPATVSPNRIGPPGSASLVLLGGGLLALVWRRRALAAYLGLAVCLINLLPAVGFVYGIAEFYSQPRLTGIAWSTVIALISLGAGLMLAQTNDGPASLLFRPDAGGAVLRRLLPAVILIPLLLGYIHTQFRLHGVYDIATGTGLLIIALILVFSILLWRNAALLSLSATNEAIALRSVRESEARLNHAQLIANVGSWEWNLETGALAWSDQIYRQVGEQPGRFTPNHDAFRQRIHPADRTSFAMAIEQALAGTRLFDLEFRIVRPDGEIRVLHSRGEVLPGHDNRPGRMIGTSVDITRRKQAEEALRQANADLERKVQERTEELAKRAAQLRALAGKLTLSEQRERRRMAKVMHDHLQQILVGAKFRVAILGRTGDDVVRQAAQEVEDLLDESIRTSRSLTAQLSPPILHDAGLDAGLQWLARWMADRHGLLVDLQIEEGTPTLAEDVVTMLFEATRELLFNTVKHARVHAAIVDVRRVENDLLQITVSDEGQGFEPAKMAAAGEPEGGFGLFGIREHLELFGGQMEIDSAPGRGSRFMLRVPVIAAAAQAEPITEPQKHVDEGQGTEAAAAGTSTRIRILLADDHVVMRQGLGQLLAQEPDFLIVGEAADGQEAVDQAGKLCPDVILMDMSMPTLSGLEATRIIHNEHPEIRILGLSMFEDSERAQAMRDAGAVGYLVKSGRSTELVAAIRSCVIRQHETHLAI